MTARRYHAHMSAHNVKITAIHTDVTLCRLCTCISSSEPKQRRKNALLLCYNSACRSLRGVQRSCSSCAMKVLSSETYRSPLLLTQLCPQAVSPPHGVWGEQVSVVLTVATHRPCTLKKHAAGAAAAAVAQHALTVNLSWNSDHGEQADWFGWCRTRSRLPRW